MNDSTAFSAPPEPSVTNAAADGRPPAKASQLWVDPERERAFNTWLAGIAPTHQLIAHTLREASADAGFRRYLRIDTQDGTSRIIMDAPPALENCEPFVRIAALTKKAGLRSPEVLDWNQADGFILLSDLGNKTLLETLERPDPQIARDFYVQAVDALISWQLASQPGVLPEYDEPVLREELESFPDWYISRHRNLTLSPAQKAVLDTTFDLIVANNLAAPKVYVHRDFMPRNLMPSASGEPIGVLDFQDALYGPITYDIASLMRDAFLSWDEEFVLDITVRYWERARKVGLMDFEDWSSNFGSFWRSVEWMGLQRHIKVAGRFARLSLRDSKPKYLADAPRFISYIRHTAGRYRELTPLLRLVDDIEGSSQASGWAFGRV
ncbi:aminoglycoside phosphotransferase family protein [Ottowia thiooxydans]|uniref:Aminoglycoside/choline kinase family phosphotransferase n=1 Tax=Ottowia thiooxydans TaxID=219182 RepID=A0ABV2QCX3_9BURK